MIRARADLVQRIRTWSGNPPGYRTLSNTPVSRFFSPGPRRSAGRSSRCRRRRQHLRERQRAAEIEQTVGAAERVRAPSRPSARSSCRETPCATARAVSTIVSVPCVTTMRVLGTARAAAATITCAVGVGHVEAVHHHQRLDRRLDARAPEAAASRADACRRTTSLPRDLVVGLVERAAGDEDANHRRRPLRDVRTRSTPPTSQAAKTMAITINTTRSSSTATLNLSSRHARPTSGTTHDHHRHRADDVVPEERHLGRRKASTPPRPCRRCRPTKAPLAVGPQADRQHEDAEDRAVEERPEPVHHLDERAELRRPHARRRWRRRPRTRSPAATLQIVTIARRRAAEAPVEVDHRGGRERRELRRRSSTWPRRRSPRSAARPAPPACLVMMNVGNT